MSKNIALILGITGQDGALLAHILLNKSYRVIGQSRSVEQSNLINLKHLNILDKIDIKNVSLLDQQDVKSLIYDVAPDDVYNFFFFFVARKMYQETLNVVKKM